MNTSPKSDMKSFLDPTIKAIGTALELPASIWLFDEEKKEFRIACAYGLSDEFVRDAVVSEERAVSVIKEKFENRKNLIVPDIQASSFWKRKAEAKAMNLKSAVASTLRIKTQAVGGLVVYVPKDITADLGKLAIKVESFAVEIANTLRYLRGLEILNKSAQWINEEILSPDLFEKVLKSAANILNCEHINLFLQENESNHLILKVSSTPDIQKKNRFKIGEGLAGWVAQTGESLIVPDRENDKRFVKGFGAFSKVKERSMLLSPIKSKDKKVIGVICADAVGLDVFDSYDLMLWESFTRQTEIALQNKDLYDQKIEAIGKISASIAGSFDLEQILDNILSWTRKLIGEPSLVEIRLLDKMTNELVVECFQGTSTDDKYKRIPVGKGITGWVGLHRKSQLINDVKNDSRYLRFLDGTNSELAVPICKNDKLIGVLNIEHPELGAFTKDHLQLAEAIANLAAIAIENARLYDNIETRVCECTLEINAIYKISEAALESKNLNDLYVQLYEIIKNIIPSTAKNFRIGIYNDENNKFEIPFFIDEWDKLSDKDLMEKGTTGYVFHTGESLICTPDKRNKLIQEGKIKLIGNPSKSWLGVPLKKDDNRCIGVIVVQSYEKEDAFGEAEKKFLEFVSKQIVMAIEKVRYWENLQKEIQRRTAKLDAVYKISEATHTIENINELYAKIREIIEGLMPANNFYIALYDSVTGKGSLPYFINEKNKTLSLKIFKRGLTGYVLRTGQPLLCTPAIFDNLVERGELDKFGTPLIDWLGVPLKIQQKTIGVLALQSYTDKIRYTEKEKEILIFISEQIAMAIERVRAEEKLNMYRYLEKLKHYQQSLIDLSQKLTYSRQMKQDEILDIIYRNTSKVMDTSNMFIVLYDEQTDLIHFPLVFKDGKPTQVMEGEERKKSGKKGRTEYIIETKQSMFYETKAQAKEWYRQSGHGEFMGDEPASFIGVPMMSGDKVLGVIATYHPTKDYVYSKDDLEILQTMAKISAIALQNARLYQRLNENVCNEEQLKTISAKIAHRIHNQLSAYDGIEFDLESEATNPDRQNMEILSKRLRETTAKIKNVTNEFNWYLKPILLKKEPVHIDRLIQNEIQKYLPKAEIHVTSEQSIPVFKADEFRLSESINELIQNAIKAGAGKINISAELLQKTSEPSENEEFLKLSIEDDGSGISPDFPIFKPFSSTSPKGTGLGLAIVKEVVETHGGRIALVPKAGQGTRFEIHIPIER